MYVPSPGFGQPNSVTLPGEAGTGTTTTEELPGLYGAPLLQLAGAWPGQV